MSKRRSSRSGGGSTGSRFGESALLAESALLVAFLSGSDFVGRFLSFLCDITGRRG